MATSFNLSDVFISYARKDKEFVHRLDDALRRHPAIDEIWIDWEDIPPSGDWWRNIQAGIENSHTFLFVISPDSIESQVCSDEIEHAAQHNKRIIPILYRDVGDDRQRAKIHPAISRVNWIFFHDSDDFDQSVEQLIEAITFDQVHLTAHTRYLERAKEWENNRRDDSYLLRGSALDQAEAWLNNSTGKDPQPTELHYAYIRESAKTRNPLQRLFGGRDRQDDDNAPPQSQTQQIDDDWEGSSTQPQVQQQNTQSYSPQDDYESAYEPIQQTQSSESLQSVTDFDGQTTAGVDDFPVYQQTSSPMRDLNVESFIPLPVGTSAPITKSASIDEPPEEEPLTGPVPEPDTQTRQRAQQFQNTEIQIKRIKERFANGEISQDERLAQMREQLLFDDVSWSWWLMGVDTDYWYRYEESTQEWMQETPPPLKAVRDYERWVASAPVVLGDPIYTSFLHADRGQRDLLDITPDVEALATLVAADNTPLPLAIGIFGKWGSGKTFFMNKLSEKIAQLSTLNPPPDTMPDAPRFYKQIAQIKFNAWHYVEGNLWAGLVEYIFSELVRFDKEKLKDEKSLLEEALKFHEEEKAVAEQLQEDARDELKTAQDNLTDLQDELAEKRAELSKVTARDVIGVMLEDESVTEETKKLLNTLQIGNLIKANQELNLAIAENQPASVRLWETIRGLSFRQIGAIVILLVFTPIILLGLREMNSWGGIEAIGVFVGAAASIVSGAAAFLRAYANAQIQAQEALLEKQSKLAEQVDAKHKALLDEIASKETEIAGLEAQIQSAEQTKQQAQEKVNKTEEKLEALRPDRVLQAFINDRTTTDDYRKHLGIPAIIRRDLEKLSQAIKDYNAQLRQNRVDGTEVKSVIDLNRIVLYIDDLDRCPPDVVVKVLEAVHLISAFEAFVVVVGVDMYWLQQALDAHIEGMSIDAAKYLKKIFQIPLWLLPMSEEATKKYLRGLLEDNILPEPEPEPEPEKTPNTDMPDIKAEEKSSQPEETMDDMPEINKPQETAPKPEPEATPQPVADQTPADDVAQPVDDQTSADDVAPTVQPDPAPQPPPQIATNLAALQTDRKEMLFIESLASIIGNSPRESKRFINLYRLFKVSGLAQKLNIDVAQNPEIVMTMLAIFVGQDDASDYLLIGIERDPRKQQTLEQLLQAADKAAETTSNNNAENAQIELTNIRQWLLGHPELMKLDVRSLVYHIARYSFELAG